MALIVKDLVTYVGIDTVLPYYYYVTLFKEFMAQEHIELPCCFPDIEQITRVTTCVEINNSYVIKTPEDAAGTNASGQMVTGNKLIIEGTLHQTIQYVADNCEHSVHLLEVEHCFGTYAVLPKDSSTTNIKSSYTVIPYVEDVCIEQVGARDMIKCVTVFLEVQ